MNYYSKDDLVKTLSTGKIPKKRNLFKKLFALAGLEYRGIEFSDGYKDRKSRVVLRYKFKDITKDHLDTMQQYVPSLALREHHQGKAIALYYKNEVDWKKIDEQTKQLSRDKSRRIQ